MTLYNVVQGGVVNAADVTQFVNLLTGAMTDQPVTISNRIRAQLAGASAGSGGYVGHTTGGPPTSGTFIAGDYLVDALGALWTCTAPGSPGTWQAIGAHRISTTTLAADAASMTFASIPQTYKHLLVIASGRTANAGDFFDDLGIRLNSDTAANYGSAAIFSKAGAAPAVAQVAGGQTSGTVGGLVFAGGTAGATDVGHSVLYIPNYTSTTIRKGGTGQGSFIGLAANTYVVGSRNFAWASTAAITTITFTPVSGANIKAGAIFTLFGMG